MKCYRMVIEDIKTGERQLYISRRQGATPPGYKLIGIAGCHEKQPNIPEAGAAKAPAERKEK